MLPYRWKVDGTVTSKKKIAFGTAMALCASAALFWNAAFSGGEGVTTMEFEKSKWTDEVAIYDEPHIRVKMVDAVIKDHLKVGMTESEVTDLLGPATDTPYFKEFDLVYWLGSEEKTFSVDSVWLVISLKDGAVAEFKKVTD